MEAVLGDSDDTLVPIVDFAPDILFFGYDQHIPEELLRQKFPYLTWKRIGAHHPEIFKSSLLRKKHSHICECQRREVNHQPESSELEPL